MDCWRLGASGAQRTHVVILLGVMEDVFITPLCVLHVAELPPTLERLVVPAHVSPESVSVFDVA